MSPSSFSLLFLSSIVCSALAQYGAADSSSSTATATSAAAAASASNIHQVAVGKNGLVFTPDTITAAAGDTIEFTFAPGGHSVTRSTFSNPCQAATTDAIWSGFASTSDMFVLKVNDTNPIWLFCSQVSHCQTGMAMVVNPPKSGANTLAAYKAAAANTGSSTSPPGVEGGLILPLGAAVASSGSSGSSSSGSAASSTSSATSATSSTQSSTANVLTGNLKWALVTMALLTWRFRA